MGKDSALEILPSFRLQIKDANRIFMIITLIAMLGDFILLSLSDNWVMVIIVTLCSISGLAGIITYRKFLPILLKSDSAADYYISALIEYVFILMGIGPICIYLYVEQQWNLLNRYGTDCLFLFNRYENWLIPISVLLMVSGTYWLIIYHIKKESRLFYRLEKKKKELYE